MNHNKLWNILKEIGIPNHLNCLLRNLYAEQEATVITRPGTMDSERKGVCQHWERSMSTPYIVTLFI